MSSDFAIKVENLSKCYHIYDKPQDRLLQMFAWGGKKFYREFWALKSISFEVKKGETLGIIGRNGSGKSTLLQMICGTLNPSAGTVETEGRIAALLELGSGFNPEFTGRENIYMNASVLGLTQEEIDERFENIAAFADIGEFIEQPIKTYSSGMVVRLAFAVIAHVDADILVIDEALAVGDTIFTQKCMRFIREFKSNGTLLFVSHDQNAVSNLCSEAIWLSEGYVVAKGKTVEILQKYHSYNLVEVQNEIESEGVESHAVEKKLDESDVRYLAVKNNNNFFSKNKSAGQGKAVISGAAFLDEFGKKIEVFGGGENVRLCFLIDVNEAISKLLVGFTIKDRLGQTIIEENNSTFVDSTPIQVKKQSSIFISFMFRMPILRGGKYSVDLAVAEGHQDNHIQQMWLYDALNIEFTDKQEVFGLFTMGLDNFEIEEIYD